MKKINKKTKLILLVVALAIIGITIAVILITQNKKKNTRGTMDI